MMDLLIRVFDKHFELVCWTVVVILLTGGIACAVYHLAWGALLLGLMAGFAGTRLGGVGACDTALRHCSL